MYMPCWQPANVAWLTPTLSTGADGRCAFQGCLVLSRCHEGMVMYTPAGCETHRTREWDKAPAGRICRPPCTSPDTSCTQLDRAFRCRALLHVTWSILQVLGADSKFPALAGDGSRASAMALPANRSCCLAAEIHLQSNGWLA